MTDIAPDPISEPFAATAPPDGFIAKDVYDREVADRIKERNLYKPYARTVGQLEEAQRQAILGLAEMAARGDVDGIVEWSLGTIESLEGKSAAEVIAARQAAAYNGAPLAAATAPAPVEQPAFSREDMIAEARQAARAELEQSRTLDAVKSRMDSAGIDPWSPSGRAVVEIAKGIPGTDPLSAIDQAIKVFREDILAHAQQAQVAAAAIAGAVPAPAPGGAPVGSLPVEGMSSRDRALARLTAQAG